uniref:Major facilitator superfamily (MFS) profile domain-containing protein n=2 Tax=Clastoptera arizonana TaxID=38151 RepID=A0A1B6E3G3_9HEMI
MLLSFGQKYSYGVGHVLNDLCASMWFTYILIFYNKVLLFSEALSGAILLVGQIADGIATPFIGYFSDRGSDGSMCNYGRRKAWHLFGSICVVLSFPFIFSPCIGCAYSHQWAQMIYYSGFVVIFQFGWAAVQIAHLALVSELTPDEHERTSLIATRYSFTVISNIIVYVIMWIVLSAAGGDYNAAIVPADMSKFQIVTYSVVALGIVMTVIFHLGVDEKRQESLLEQTPEERQVVPTRVKPYQLFLDIKIYHVSMIYMTTRLFANLSQTIFPLYLHDDLKLGGENLATLPLVYYVSSFFITWVIKKMNKRLGRNIAFIIGAAIGVGVSIWVRFGEGEIYKTYLIYVVSALFGISSSIMLVTSLGITADLIGVDNNNGAFIYGMMSLFDKVSNGGAVMAIQYWKCFPTCEQHYRDSLSYYCGVSSLVGILSVFFLAFCCRQPSPEETHIDAIAEPQDVSVPENA